MKIYILINDFDFRVEMASCDGGRVQGMANSYNGEGCFGPYNVVELELEDVPQQTASPDTEKPVIHDTRCPHCNHLPCLGEFDASDCISI